jgi:hypothetical protein
MKRCFTRVGLSLACKDWTKLEKLARDKQYSSLLKSVNYDCNKFYSTGPKRECHQGSQEEMASCGFQLLAQKD